ncbi:hypothetical protein [Microvirga thermotolerans]|uniref:Uncharacterized protein n=1 Tax=Microvirga thermotolerans TaxID=2651334 RepID=A0A5P9K287_9HYPH|nr:hypothetical protein [Microvirga thermotolerans]QFU16324.1 hypothetical protein GDR74_08850 [Microvirga thermotolerans]
MPIFDSLAVNDNDEAQAFLRAVLAAPARRAAPRHPDEDARLFGVGIGAPPRHARPGVPLIVGVAVSIAVVPPAESSTSSFCRRRLP